MPRPPARPVGEKSTREQILDVALDLFTAEGFEKTSLREIAERMGFSKAALYYHFASKDDILLALHLRLHELGRATVDQIDWDRVAPSDWVGMLDEFIDQLFDNRKLFLLHMRNHGALEKISHRHDDENHDFEERFRALLSDARVPRAQRLRLSFAFGAVAAGMVMSGEILADVSTEELRAELRSAVRDLLGPAATPDLATSEPQAWHPKVDPERSRTVTA